MYQTGIFGCCTTQSLKHILIWHEIVHFFHIAHFSVDHPLVFITFITRTYFRTVNSSFTKTRILTWPGFDLLTWRCNFRQATLISWQLTWLLDTLAFCKFLSFFVNIFATFIIFWLFNSLFPWLWTIRQPSFPLLDFEKDLLYFYFAQNMFPDENTSKGLIYLRLSTRRKIKTCLIDLRKPLHQKCFVFYIFKPYLTISIDSFK